MEKKRVLQIGLTPNYGGIENLVYNWWTNFSREELEFDFINVWDRPLAFQEEFIAGGAKIYYKPMRKNKPAESYEQLKHIIKNGKYDYIHYHVMSLSEPEPVVIASKFSDSNIIVHSHTAASRKMMGIKRYLIHLYGKIVLKKYDYIKVACGKKAGINMFGSKDFRVIRNGVNRQIFKYSVENREEIRRLYNIEDDVFLIGHVGRPCEAKNYLFLISVFAEFLKNHTAKLILVGNIFGYGKINELIEKLDIGDKVIFAGVVKNTYKYYSAMDCFYMPSLYEGISVALIEAQSTGLPCVVSDRVDCESKASDKVRFVGIDSMVQSLEALDMVYSQKDGRTNVKFLDEYDIDNSLKSVRELYAVKLDDMLYFDYVKEE